MLATRLPESTRSYLNLYYLVSGYMSLLAGFECYGLLETAAAANVDCERNVFLAHTMIATVRGFWI